MFTEHGASRVPSRPGIARMFWLLPALASGVRDFARQNRGRTLRQKAHALIFADPNGGQLNLLVEVFLIACIVLSVLSIVFESVEDIGARYATAFYVVDLVSFVVFAAEYLCRLYASPEEAPHVPAWQARLRFLTSWQGLLDLVAIVPFMLAMLLSGFVDLRFLRIIRLVRLLKLSRYSAASDTMFAVIRKELPVLLASSLVMGLLVFLMAASGYLLEREAQPDKFENIPQALYWAVITLASVGYGDISPVTAGGRFATVVLALVGIGIFAIPAAVLASGFTEQLRLNRERIKQELMVSVGDAELDDQMLARLVGQARQAHLTEVEIREMIDEIEIGRRNEAEVRDLAGSVTLMASNPAYALSQFRTLLARMQELAAVADLNEIDRQLQKPGAAGDLERQVWQQLRDARGD